MKENEKGQGLVEYALILALIVLVGIVGLAFIGDQVTGMLSQTGNSINAWVP